MVKAYFYLFRVFQDFVSKESFKGLEIRGMFQNLEAQRIEGGFDLRSCAGWRVVMNEERPGLWRRSSGKFAHLLHETIYHIINPTLQTSSILHVLYKYSVDAGYCYFRVRSNNNSLKKVCGCLVIRRVRGIHSVINFRPFFVNFDRVQSYFCTSSGTRRKLEASMGSPLVLIWVLTRAQLQQCARTWFGCAHILPSLAFRLERNSVMVDCTVVPPMIVGAVDFKPETTVPIGIQAVTHACRLGFLPVTKPWMLPGPHRGELTTTRTLFIFN